MAAGRKPLPTSMRMLSGNAGHRPLNADEPTPSPGFPLRPPHLTTEASKAWDDFAPTLHTLGLLTAVDGTALEQLCEIYVDVVKLRADVAQNGRIQVVMTKSGDAMIRARPEVAMLDAAQRQLRMWLEAFGLTPSARSRLKAFIPDQPDIFEELLKQSSQ
ncbi:phage terminase small subunit P27 family [Azospirillum brasilense]|nr:phage terminase small subunit P27 family [Azospirillum brasilense]